MSECLSRRALLAGALAGAVAMRTWGKDASRPPAMRRLIANENPYGPSPSARAAATRAVKNGWRYAVREVGALKADIAQLEGVEPSQVMVCAGSTEALRVSALALAGQGGRVVAASPTFFFLPDYARKLGCEVAEVPLDDAMTHDLDAMAAAVNPATKLMYVCNPNNPTGTQLDVTRLGEFIAAVSPRAPVLVDEAYLDLNPDWRALTAVARVRAGDAVIVTRTFSKLHGMAGLRVGYAVGPAELIRRLEALRVSQMSYPGVLAAAASLADAEFLDFSREKIRAGRAVTMAVFDELGLAYRPSHGNFVFFDTGGSPRAFAAGMRERGILTGMPSAAYPSWSRVSMGRVEDMQAFTAAARDYFRSPG
ncbi:MAG: histidinol-phosphate aminotransferase family protein [Chromatiales bacterium]|nr:MAG: histidinol-phosphate aminotransferase family protein [Chromatiales bacterium]